MARNIKLFIKFGIQEKETITRKKTSSDVFNESKKPGIIIELSFFFWIYISIKAKMPAVKNTKPGKKYIPHNLFLTLTIGKKRRLTPIVRSINILRRSSFLKPPTLRRALDNKNKNESKFNKNTKPNNGISLVITLHKY